MHVRIVCVNTRPYRTVADEDYKTADLKCYYFDKILYTCFSGVCLVLENERVQKNHDWQYTPMILLLLCDPRLQNKYTYISMSIIESIRVLCAGSRVNYLNDDDMLNFQCTSQDGSEPWNPTVTIK